MPHYADGSPATVGDTVRGKGYNIKGPDGQLAEITGTLLHVDPNSTACNVQVGVVEIEELPDRPLESGEAGMLASRPLLPLPARRVARLRLEYGQADHFLKV